MQPRTHIAWGGCFFLAWEWSIWRKGRLLLVKKVAVIMGSDSDLPVLESCFQTLRKLNIPYETHVYSAHRTPDAAGAFAASARENGFGVIIAAAGKAAHLAGALAARTVLPVIGIPVKASALEGLDALLSTVQMPGGIPVATVAHQRLRKRGAFGRADSGHRRRGPCPHP